MKNKLSMKVIATVLIGILNSGSVLAQEIKKAKPKKVSEYRGKNQIKKDLLVNV